MIWNLIYKELRIAAHPTLYVFVLLGALVIVPAYPYGTVFLYGCFAPAITMMYARETNDAYFTALLPVRKRDVVRAKCGLVALAQIVQMLISLPFAVLRVHTQPGGNPVGIEANVAYYGFGLMIYALFNAIFFTRFYKTGYKAGVAFIWAIIPMTVGIVAMEALAHFPALAWLDSVVPDALIRQLPVLLVGMAVYIGGMVGTYRVAAARFERVDL